ncbi:MAG: AbrB/MazE/SpoVT family DNA-binding domain-containing protein [Dehalococcoidales bacterium]|nr:AbrB/MazE/SpoVT family DNA-binding domain-containing protein [Dehalococcoidales bacterium]
MADSRRKRSGKYVDRRLMKMGGSLVMAVPDEMVKQWNLEKGDQVRVTVLEDGVKVEPKQLFKVEAVSPESIESYSKAMAGIQAEVIMSADDEISLKFSGSNKDTVRVFARKLWHNLPLMLRLMGLGSVDELPHGKGRKSKEVTK